MEKYEYAFKDKEIALIYYNKGMEFLEKGEL